MLSCTLSPYFSLPPLLCGRCKWRKEGKKGTAYVTQIRKALLIAVIFFDSGKKEENIKEIE